jgi:predicted HTH domain antitoxin
VRPEYYKNGYFCNMRTVHFNIPENVDLDDQDIAMLVASTLYEKGKLSLGQAAELAGLSKRTFAELLGKYGVSIFNYSPTDLTNDVNNA